MNKLGKDQLTIGAIVIGSILVIVFCGFLIWGLSNDISPTGEAIKQGSWIVIGYVVLFLLFILIVVILFFILKNIRK